MNIMKISFAYPYCYTLFSTLIFDLWRICSCSGSVNRESALVVTLLIESLLL